MTVVSLVVLDFLKAKQVTKNVAGILRQKGPFELEVLIGDNSINAKNAAMLIPLANDPRVSVEIFSDNSGYTRANNRLAQKATGDFLFVVNPDIEWPTDDIIARMISFLEKNPTVGIVGPRQMVEKTGETERTARRFPSLFTQLLRRSFFGRLSFFQKRVARDEMRDMNLTKRQEVQWLQSSFVAMRTTFFRDLGGFSEAYFLFMADTELCQKSWSAKKKVVFLGDVVVFADGVRCSAGGVFDFFRKKTIRIHLRDSLRYFWRR